jgi:hypothetical protein
MIVRQMKLGVVMETAGDDQWASSSLSINGKY